MTNTWPEIKPGVVDIVLPCHRSNAPLLARSIGSVMSQTYQDWVLTVVDDENCPEFAGWVREAGRGDPRVKFLSNGKNIGLPATLERGFMSGTGEFVGFTSDDNWYEPSFMEEMASFMRSEQLGFCRCMQIHVDPAGREMHLFDSRHGDSELPRIKHDGHLGGGHLLRRSTYFAVVDRFGVGWDTALQGIEDLDMYYKIIEVGAKVGFLDKALYHYRVGTSRFARTAVAEARQRFMKKWGI